MTDGFLWRDAKVTYPDMSGTAQLDERQTSRVRAPRHHPLTGLQPAQIEEVVGLDSTKWSVIGLDIGGGEHDHELRVVAVHSDLVPDGGDVWPKVAASNNGEIPATEFLVHNVDPYEVLKAITHVFEMRLRVRGCRDLPIRIMAQSDLPEQFMQ